MKTWAEKLSSKNKQCRAFGHAWTSGTTTRYRVDAHTVGSVVVCERCETERLTLYDRNTMDQVNRRYNYPDGYSKPDADSASYSRRDFTTIVVMTGKREKTLPPHWEERLSRWYGSS